MDTRPSIEQDSFRLITDIFRTNFYLNIGTYPSGFKT